MDQHSEYSSSEFSPLQRELYDVTGNVFEIGLIAHDSIELLFEGIHVYSIPSTALQNPAEVRDMEFPDSLMTRVHGSHTLRQRRALIEVLTTRSPVRRRLHELLKDEMQNHTPAGEMATLVEMEEWLLNEELRKLVWKLDDVTVQRWCFKLPD